MANKPKVPRAQKTAASAAPKAATVRLRPHYLNDHGIIFANITRFTHIGAEIILDIGTLDDQQLVKMIQEKSSEAVIDAFITHRFGMGLQSFLKLKENVDDLITKLVEAGVVEPAPDPTAQGKQADEDQSA